MSRMHREIRRSMSGLRAGENGRLQAGFLFPKEFIGFQGHFENNPVLPGICKIQSVVAMFDEFHGRPFRLKEVSMAKYLSPVTAGQPIVIDCSSGSAEEGTVAVKVSIRRAEERVAILHLILEENKL